MTTGCEWGWRRPCAAVPGNGPTWRCLTHGTTFPAWEQCPCTPGATRVPGHMKENNA